MQTLNDSYDRVVIIKSVLDDIANININNIDESLNADRVLLTIIESINILLSSTENIKLNTFNSLVDILRDTILTSLCYCNQKKLIDKINNIQFIIVDGINLVIDGSHIKNKYIAGSKDGGYVLSSNEYFNMMIN